MEAKKVEPHLTEEKLCIPSGPGQKARLYSLATRRFNERPRSGLRCIYTCSLYLIFKNNYVGLLIQVFLSFLLHVLNSSTNLHNSSS